VVGNTSDVNLLVQIQVIQHIPGHIELQHPMPYNQELQLY
jgi:hypothetical protein